MKTDDEESGSSALTMRAPPVQIDKAFLEGEAQWVKGVEGLAGITGKQPVKLRKAASLLTKDCLGFNCFFFFLSFVC